MNKKNIITAWIVSISIIVVGLVLNNANVTKASTPVGSSYKSIQTGPTNTNTNVFQSTVIASSYGTLGSVILTQPASGGLILYDATTSNVNLRAGATTTLKILAQFVGAQATSTYVFDEDFYNGLVLEFTGNVATSTITYR